MRLPDGNDLWLPVLAAAGQADGPTLAVLAGVGKRHCVPLPYAL